MLTTNLAVVFGKERRARFVAQYRLPPSVGPDLLERYPHLSQTGIAAAKVGLRQWFRLHTATSRLLGMPSMAVDLLWHEFILDTAEYSRFCRKAYGGLLHHRPASQMAGLDEAAINRAMALTYAMACRDEGMPVRAPVRLPALFSADADLDLSDGQRWVLTCGDQTGCCRADESTRCMRHTLIPLLPSDLPKQLRVGPGGQTFYAGGLISGGGATGAFGGGGHSSGGHGHGCGGHGCGGGGGH